MKYLSLFIMLNVFYLTSYSQDRNNTFLVFFINDFKKDSIRVLLNEKEIMNAVLNTDPASGQCPDFTMFTISDSTQYLTLVEVHTNKKYKSIIKKDARYLYIYKVETTNYRFDYSNKLSLPE